MKKITLTLVIAVFLFSVNAFSQMAPLFKDVGKQQISSKQQGASTQLNFGFGLGNWGLPIYGGIDFAIHEDVTIGPQVVLILDDDYNAFGVSFRGDYHFNRLLNLPEEFDLYAGANINHYFSDYYEHPTNFDLQIGARWFWSNFGLNIEFGGGAHNTGGRFGLTLRF